MSELLRRLPAVSAVLAHPAVQALAARFPQPLVTKAVQDTVSSMRARMLRGEAFDGVDLLALAVADACLLAAQRGAAGVRRVVNATGTVLHTNLGRALIAPAAVEAMVEAASYPTSLEYDLAAGTRGSRHDHLTSRLTMLSGAEDGFGVNNNAAAVLLMLNTLAEGREVIVSRGELVEIGGSFRIPDVMQKSGAKLVEVGTTNRTHPDDYRHAVTPATALLLKVHTSNYRVVGFTSEVPAAELAAIGAERGLPLMYDLGSGAAFDFARAGLAGETTLAQAVATGAAVVTASGDKLLGGPQAGLILGRRELLARARRNPLARALRLDKVTIAAMQATLDLYLRHGGDLRSLGEAVPVVGALTRDAGELAAAAAGLAALIGALPGNAFTADVVPGTSAAGGGSFPEAQLPTWLVAVRCDGLSAGMLAERLRNAPMPVIGRVEDDRLLLDPRTLRAGDVDHILSGLRHAVALTAGPVQPI